MLSDLEILALTMVPGITSAGVRALVESGMPIDAITSAAPGWLAAMGLRRAAIEGVAVLDLHLDRAHELAREAERRGAAILTFWDERYPARLRQIYAPPMVLYMHGSLVDSDERAVAVVGTRRATLYGRMAAERYATGLAQAGVTVVSGLARGIDMFAHAAAMRAGGRTIAVVASGLDRIQPNHAADTALKIAAHGAVLTEYPFGVKALRPYFPQRNRIISGMCAGTVIVESNERGGAMITADFALDQNRDVFAVPGPIIAEQSRGVNMLIRTDRARLTQSPDDVLEALGYRIAAGDLPATLAVGMDLSVFEQQILDALSEEPAHVDVIGERAGLGPSETLVSLLGLEFKGLARQMAGKLFVRT